jgi:hypothetical protein
MMGGKMRVLAFFIALAAFSVTGWGDNTLRGKLKAAGARVEHDTVAPAPFDTIVAPGAEVVRLSGYDKPLRSSAETLFVSNGLEVAIEQLAVRIVYSDMSGRQLHERVVELRVHVPAGATRQVRFKSWDTQKSFYYHRGQRPRVDAVTPYSVNCMVNSCVIKTRCNPDSIDKQQ